MADLQTFFFQVRSDGKYLNINVEICLLYQTINCLICTGDKLERILKINE